MGLRLLAGRDFDPDRQADWFSKSGIQSTASAIVTASLARRAGYSDLETVVGERWMIGEDNVPTELHIVGVVDDFLIGSTEAD